MKLEYQQAKLESVIKFWADEYKSKDGREVYNYEWYLDQAKGVVIFRLYTRPIGQEDKQ